MTRSFCGLLAGVALCGLIAGCGAPSLPDAVPQAAPSTTPPAPSTTYSAPSSTQTYSAPSTSSDPSTFSDVAPDSTTSSGGSSSSSSGPELDSTVYIVGRTLEWNGIAGNYDVSGTFDRKGRVIVTESESRNGYEVAVISGSVIDTDAGALTFYSNTEMTRFVSGAASYVATAAVPVADVDVGSDGSVTAELDPSMARTTQLLLFGRDRMSQVQISDGTITITRSGDEVSGEIELNGSGYIEPGNGAFPTKAYRATFSS